ncbi:ABC transporter ATP-binding protein [Cryptosporangium aurantiacum]|uniref:ABC-2 type transport system ATP-binding protein n=1 Tax=Cryptosporangium aurantiacum TaxID=134849 RepID=A0A1M7RPA2_9ACTN|nr:ABC transporter ATP-binding protein [Cryptosporangium aurantiacum]SHN47990.1 ABC-2 type transport system ATP-binding protein [Cryptosporangium aurantiacum]
MTTSPDTAAVEVSDLRRRYHGGFEAVRGVSFTVRRGELVALLGTNGAGKTSTMEVIEGLARPSGGSVRVLGRDPIRDRTTVRPDVGIMLQSSGMPGDLTVAESLQLWAGTCTAPRPVDEAIELVRLTEKSGTAVKQLSGGEQRRLDLALAVLGRPKVLFLDEPTTGLDPESRRATWSLLATLLAEGTSMLLTTHYLEEAERLADRLVILHEGLVVAAGTVDDVVAAHPAQIRYHGLRPPTLVGNETVTVEGDRVTILTRSLQGSLTALLAWAAASQIELAHLAATPATLETAFLALSAERNGRLQSEIRDEVTV